MIVPISSTKDILKLNKTCIFCKSNLILSFELALTKINTGFNIQDNYLVFNSDPKYFNYARINLNSDEFQISRTQNSGFFINYKSVNFVRKCFDCKFDFTIKYSKYKFSEIDNKLFGKPSLDSLSFKFINNKKNYFFVMNHFEYNTSKIIHMSYVNDSFLQVVKEYKFDHQINFDYSSTRKIKNKLYSIAIFV